MIISTLKHPDTIKVGAAAGANGVVAMVGHAVDAAPTFLLPWLQVVVAIVTVGYVGLKGYSVYLDVRKKRRGEKAPEQD